MATLLLLMLAFALLCLAAQAGKTETLYNGIELPAQWPPDEPLTTDPPALPPYLVAPPAVIPIDLGRQLFVDDFLVESTTLERRFHHAEYYPGNPVLRPDQPWEMEGGPTAMPFSDGVWYDPADRTFKMWYMGGYLATTCYAVSQDGIHWTKPRLDVEPGTNIVQRLRRDSNTIWLDEREKDPARRWKMAVYGLQQSPSAGLLTLFASADGLHWDGEIGRTGPTGDRATIFFNPFRNVWVYGVRDYLPDEGLGRIRRYWEHRDLLKGAKWEAGQPVMWTGADRLDHQRPELATPCELYNLDCVAYESVLLGLFDIWRGQPADRPKPNEVCLGTSRDGFHWYRPDRQPFIPVSERQGDWNWGNIQTAGGCCLVVGDQLYFYVSGRAGVPGSSASGVCSTGLATLRRDGFASMEAVGKEGMLTTRPVTFRGRYPFVNADADRGELRVEVLDQAGQVIEPFTKANAVPMRGDSTRHRLQWQGAADLAALRGRPVRFRFHLRDGGLYAFWVSSKANGASGGYVAAGGPGLKGGRDL